MSITREESKEMVGKGWSSLLDEIYDKLPTCAEVVQVKEKFGGLRFYVDYIDDDTQNFICKIEEKSLSVCENCGKQGKQIKTRGWIKTQCETCQKSDSIKFDDYNKFFNKEVYVKTNLG